MKSLLTNRWTSFIIVVIGAFSLLSSRVTGGNWWWQTPVRYPNPVNTHYNEVSPFLTDEGNTLYFASDRVYRVDVKADKAVQDWEIYKSTWNGFTWSEPAGIPSITSRYSESHPFISSDGNYLFFGSNRPSGNSGLWDIYHAAKSGSSWGSPVNTGTTVNSAGNDITPGLSANGLTLYFASDRAGGAGGFDIWQSTRATTASPWGTPSLLSVCNSPYNDFCPRFLYDSSTQMEYLYFTSERAGGCWNIYFCQRSSGGAWSGPTMIEGPISTVRAEGYPFVTAGHQKLLYATAWIENPSTVDVTRYGGLDIWYAVPGEPVPSLTISAMVLLVIIIGGLLHFFVLSSRRSCGDNE